FLLNFSSSAIFTAVASLFYWQRELSSLAVETSSGSRNSITGNTASDGTGKKKGRTVTVTAEDMQKRKNDVKARTTLLLSLSDEHQLRFSKYKTAQELWAVILKTFGGNEATKKTKKNILEQQYGNFKAEGSETLEHMFNRLQKKSKPNSQNMSFISSIKHSRGNEDVNTASVSTTSTNVPTARLPEARTEEEETTTDKGLKLKNRVQKLKSRLAEHRDREIKYCKKIRGLEFKTESSDDYIECLKKELELIKKEKEGLDSKLTGFQTVLKDLDSLLESQRLDKNKEGLGYNDVPPPPAQIYSPPKKDMSWNGLPEFKDDTVTDYSRPATTIESSPDDAQNKNLSVIEIEASPTTISPKSFIKFVKANDSPTNSKTDKAETAKKPPVKYAEQYRKPTKKPNVRGNKRIWNNLKYHQLVKG
nr:hypothetical protein [Tanacetum cinerariifolium]